MSWSFVSFEQVQATISHSLQAFMETLDQEVMLPIERSAVAKKDQQLTNPFLNHLFNHPDIESAGPLREVIRQICMHPEDYTILLPSTFFLRDHIDKKSKRWYVDVCKDLDFVMSHIVRINVSKEPRIRTHKEFTTLNNKKLVIKADTVMYTADYKVSASVNILGQEFVRGFAEYIPIGTCFHVVHISNCIGQNYECIRIKRNLLINEHHGSNPLQKEEVVTKVFAELDTFETMCDGNSDLLVIDEKFKTLFVEYNFRNCKSAADLDKSFADIMKRGSAMLNTLEGHSFSDILLEYTPEQLMESVYDYLEKNVYEKLWNRYVKLSPNDEDSQLQIAYSNLQWLSLTQVGLPEEIVSDRKLLNTFIKKASAAIRYFKKLNYARTSSAKCKIVVKTVEILSADTTIDADTLIALLIFVISFARIPNLNNHLRYMKKHAYLSSRLENGIIGYATSSFEIAVKYFQDKEQLDRLSKHSEDNEQLWRLLGAVSQTNSETHNNYDDEVIFNQIEEILKPLNNSSIELSSNHFVKSISLTGESCLFYAMKQKNTELMKVLLQFEYIFTLDDILDDMNNDKSSLLGFALEMKHPYATVISEIILNSDCKEIREYVNQADANGRTVGHYLHQEYHLLPKVGVYVEWTKRDVFGNTPLMIYIRSYDHPEYVTMMEETFKTVATWYKDSKRKFSHRDHIDSKRNTPMHMIRDDTVLKLFLQTFNELEMNFLNDGNQSPVSLSVRYNKLENLKILTSDPRVCLSIVDPKMFMTSLDYVKLERWGERVNRDIAKLLEVQFIVTEYGEQLDIACVRARFDPDHGLCCYFRVVNMDNESDIVLLPFESIVKVFKLLKMENPAIPFDFGKPDIWFPKHGYVNMKGNISSSNKMRINSLINNLNLLIQSLYKNGTIELTESLQNYLLRPQVADSLEVQTLDERDVLKHIYIKQFEHRKAILTDAMKFQRIMVTNDDIVSYEGFLEYTSTELEEFLNVYQKLYRKFTFADIEAKELDKLRTDIPFIVDNSIKFRECRVEDSSDIFLDKLRLLCGTAGDLTKNIHDMRSVKIKRWKRLISDLKMIRNELDRMAGGGIVSSNNLRSSNGPNKEITKVEYQRNELLRKVFSQIELLTGESEDQNGIETMRQEIIETIYKEESPKGVSNGDDKTNHPPYLLNTKDLPIQDWFTEKRKVTYVRKLFDGFLKHRLELIDLCVDLRKTYENLAVFVSKFYAFRAGVFKDAYKFYSRGKIDELKREVMAWELSLDAYKSCN